MLPFRATAQARPTGVQEERGGGAMGEASNRRQRLRLNLPATLRGSMGLSGDLRVINLTPDGAMIEHGERLFQGQPCVLGLRLAGVNLRLRARVVWSQIYRVQSSPTGEEEIRFRSGLHFPDLPGGAEAHLRHYLGKLPLPKSDPPHGLD